MKNGLSLRAPAKINLYLKIINRREDGYHNLLSLMQMVGLYDELYFEETEKDLTLQIQNSSLSVDQNNLVFRAALLLQESMLSEGRPLKGAAIHLKKEIPVAAGLAGGSTDAVATLIALNRLWALNWPKKKLVQLSEKLGSDLPFFFDGPVAWISGRGEFVEAISAEFKAWIVLLNPGFPVSTPTVFQAFSAQSGLTNTGAATNISTKQGRPTLDEIHRHPRNDLEEVTLKQFDVLRVLKERLSAVGGEFVLMSGSGPSLFALFENQEKAEVAAAQIRKEAHEPLLQIWAIPLLETSPFSQYV